MLEIIVGYIESLITVAFIGLIIDSFVTIKIEDADNE